MFLISTIGVATLPSRAISRMCKLTFASTRRLPSCMLQSETPRYVSSSFNSVEKHLGFGRAAQVGLGDDFQQRRAGAVQVDEAVGLAGLLIVQLLPASSSRWARRMRIVFGSNAPFRIADLQTPVLRHRQVVLADLIVLRQVGIVILLAIPLGERRNFAVQCDGRFQRELERLAIHHRQRAGHADANRARLRVRLGAELRAAAAEQLARCA